MAAGFLFEVMSGWLFAIRYRSHIKNVIENMQRMFMSSETPACEQVSRKRILEYKYLEKKVYALLDANQSMRHTLKDWEVWRNKGES